MKRSYFTGRRYDSSLDCELVNWVEIESTVKSPPTKVGFAIILFQFFLCVLAPVLMTLKTSLKDVVSKVAAPAFSF
jgi:hypothetical protein